MPSKIYLLMNKPKGFVCSAVSDSHKTIYELLPLQMQEMVKNAKRGERLHTVGRLDCDTSGIILLTNDGVFSHYLTNPNNNIEKIYKVKLKNEVDKELQNIMKSEFLKGVVLPPEKKAMEEKSGSAKLEFLCKNECLITITEGKFHEVKRIFKPFNNEVQELHRIQFGKYKLPLELSFGNYINIQI